MNPNSFGLQHWHLQDLDILTGYGNIEMLETSWNVQGQVEF